MPSTFILIGAVALGTGLICLFCGYLWGRSNVRSQIEDALDQSRRIADAREYNLREALEEKMLELSKLRDSAEELPRLREKLEQLQSERMRGSARGRANAYAPEGNTLVEPKLFETVQEPAPVSESVSESADKAIQNLLKSIDERMKGTEEDSQGAIEESAAPAVTNFTVEIPPTVTQLHSKPAPPVAPPAKHAPAAKAQPAPAVKSQPSPAVKAQPAQAAKDEWQEFAASLAALKNRQK
jgi:hypothetical protein